jgi:hypothetical protein
MRRRVVVVVADVFVGFKFNMQIVAGRWSLLQLTAPCF